eukprot:6212456-Pleurochrysis_carterae.AAC.2
MGNLNEKLSVAIWTSGVHLSASKRFRQSPAVHKQVESLAIEDTRPINAHTWAGQQLSGSDRVSTIAHLELWLNISDAGAPSHSVSAPGCGFTCVHAYSLAIYRAHAPTLLKKLSRTSVKLQASLQTRSQ